MRSSQMIVVVLFVSLGAIKTPDPLAQNSPPTPFQVLEATIADIHGALRAKRLTGRALVDVYLRRIDAYDQASPRLNAVQTINSRALHEADRLDAAFRSSGPVGRLHCIP